MKVIVGSQNNAKVLAVAESLVDYKQLKDFEVIGINADSKISDQPLTLQETITGAINRAKESFESKDASYGFGIESGLMAVPHTLSGHLDVCVCAITDIDGTYIGISSAWEFPNKDISDAMTKDGLDMAQACVKFGLTDDPDIGQKGGAIGLVTNGRLGRKEYTQEAIRNALIHIEYKLTK